MSAVKCKKGCINLNVLRYIRHTLYVLFACITVSATAQDSVQTDLSLPYLVQQPIVNMANPPMIILMHGYGSNEADLFELKDAFPKNFVVVSVRAPYKLWADAYQWFGLDGDDKRRQIENSVSKIKLLVPALVKKYHADPSRVYLSGFSQGGMMSYEVGLTSPGLFKGIAPLSGRLFPQLKPDIRQSPALKRLKIFIGHGDADGRVAYSYATEAAAYLKSIGLNPILHTYKGIQHSISEQEVQDLVNWLNN